MQKTIPANIIMWLKFSTLFIFFTNLKCCCHGGGKIETFQIERRKRGPWAHLWVFFVFKHVSKSPENIHRSLHRENIVNVFKVSFSLQKRAKICFLLKYKGHFFENENFPNMIYAQKVLWGMCYHFINMEFHLNTHWWRFSTFRQKSSNSA